MKSAKFLDCKTLTEIEEFCKEAKLISSPPDIAHLQRVVQLVEKSTGTQYLELDLSIEGFQKPFGYQRRAILKFDFHRWSTQIDGHGTFTVIRKVTLCIQ